MAPVRGQPQSVQTDPEVTRRTDIEKAERLQKRLEALYPLSESILLLERTADPEKRDALINVTRMTEAAQRSTPEGRAEWERQNSALRAARLAGERGPLNVEKKNLPTWFPIWEILVSGALLFYQIWDHNSKRGKSLTESFRIRINSPKKKVDLGKRPS